MPDQDNQNPTTGSESDISKAQATQQPAGQQGQEPETAEEGVELTGDQAATGQAQPGAGPDEGLQGDTATQQRSDIEGASLDAERSEAEGGFVGSQSDADSSSELVEDQDFAKGGQGAPEGK